MNEALAIGSGSTDQAVAEVTKSLKGWESKVAALAVETPEDEAGALAMVKTVKDAGKAAEDKLDEFIGPLNTVVKNLRAVFKPHIDRFKSLEISIKQKMNAYRSEIEAAAAEERRKAEEKLRKAQAKAEETGKPMKAVYVPPPPVQTVQSNGASVTYRKVKKFEIVDESKVPRQFLEINQSKIRTAILQGIEVPGVRSWEESEAAIR